ncbi:MAG: hypothetical protein O2819_00970 [Planctomycetota bacterium]|nr:hypothetical protein [Planctomycetota bacterium]MDA1105646.1 hypothetical protein [Planctomycetota bacterium]
MSKVMGSIALALTLVAGTAVALAASAPQAEGGAPSAAKPPTQGTPAVGAPSAATGQGGSIAPEPPPLEVSAQGTINFRAKDVPVASALELLALETRRNIVAGSDVTGTISVNLFDVPFDRALAAITQAHGLVRIDEGDVIFVYTGAAWQKILEGRTARISRVYELQFISALDAMEFVKPLLSEKGSASARGTVETGISTTLATSQGDAYAGTPRLVVHDLPSVIDAVTAALAELDVAPVQIKVECAVVQAKVEENAAFGVDFSFVTSMDFSGGVSNVVSELADDPAAGTSETAIVISDMPGLPSGINPTFSAGAVLSNAAIFLTLLDQVTDTVIIARPSLQVLNRQRATVLVGERLGYLNTTQNQESTTQSVEFLDTGTKLTLRPFANPDGTIRMELSPSISTGEVEIFETTGAIATVPSEFTQELTTNISVRSGETIVLGGLFTEQTVTTRRNVPGASDVPGLGAVFEGQVDAITRNEIIFLVTPTIVSPERLYDEAKDALHLIDEVRAGTRQGLLPFARERVCADYAQRAFNAFAEGDPQSASWFVDSVLRERPSTASMVRLREQIRNGPGSPWTVDLDSRMLLTPPLPNPVSAPAAPAAPAAPGSAAPIDVGGGE